MQIADSAQLPLFSALSLHNRSEKDFGISKYISINHVFKCIVQECREKKKPNANATPFTKSEVQKLFSLRENHQSNVQASFVFSSTVTK